MLILFNYQITLLFKGLMVIILIHFSMYCICTEGRSNNGNIWEISMLCLRTMSGWFPPCQLEMVINLDFGNYTFHPGIFCQLSRESSWPRDLPQNLWKKWWLWVVVMGANTFDVHALFPLHRIWISRYSTLSRMHQRAEIVSMKFPFS